MRRRATAVVFVLLALGSLAWLLSTRLFGPEVTIHVVRERPLVQTVVATGRVAALSRVQVGSSITGVVTQTRVREGDHVQAGDDLATIRAEDLEAAVTEAQAALEELDQTTRPQAEAALKEAEASLAQASREAQRRRELFRQRAISREDMERAIQAETVARAVADQARLTAEALVNGHPNEAAARARLANAAAQLAKTIIRSEVSGIVLTRNVEPGDLVQPGTVLFEIAREGDTEILVPIDEKNLGVIALGQSASCVSDAYPNKPFSAKINFIAPRVDPQRGTVDVRLMVDPLPDFLREDMTVSVNVETGRRDRALVVPNDALQDIRGDTAHIWLAVDGRAVFRGVKLGLRGTGKTEVTEGLHEGDQILTDAPAGLSEGERIRVHMAAPASHDANLRASRNELPFSMN